MGQCTEAVYHLIYFSQGSQHELFTDSGKVVHQLRTKTSQQMAKTNDTLQTTYSRLKPKREAERQFEPGLNTRRRSDDWL